MNTLNDRLTPCRRSDVLAFIREYRAEHGFCPSIREMCESMRLRSTSTIHWHLTGLARDGLIRWQKGKNRAITIIPPDGHQVAELRPACPHCKGTGLA